MNGENIQIVKKMKILGTIVNKKLTWDDNCSDIVKRVNSRMELIRQAKNFGATENERIHLWNVYCRSVLEQSCVVWNSQLTNDNIHDLERTQRSFIRLLSNNNNSNCSYKE